MRGAFTGRGRRSSRLRAVIRVFSAWLAIARTCGIGDPAASVIRFSTSTRCVVRAISAS